MQAVILAAGRGKRMKGLTKGTSKVMLKVGGKPILEHKLDSLPRVIDEVVLIIGYQGDEIIRYFKRFFGGRRIVYVLQTVPSGTGGAIHLAKSVLHDKFLVMMGDDLYHKRDLARMVKHDLAVLGHEVEDVSRFGVIQKNNRGNMTDIIEKPKRSKENLANTGAYVLNKKFFDYDLVSVGNGEFGLPQTLAKMTGGHKVKVEKATMWHPIGTPEDLEAAEKVIHKFAR